MATTTTTRKPATGPKRTMRQRQTAVMEATTVEESLDRILVKRLRPLREEMKAARLTAAEQADLRVVAEVRAARAEDEAATLRVRLADLDQQLAVAQEKPSWWRRRRVAESQPA
jgi:hypothetical protein